jgi:hypothetical protein
LVIRARCADIAARGDDHAPELLRRGCKRAAREADRAVITAWVQANETLLPPTPVGFPEAGLSL